MKTRYFAEISQGCEDCGKKHVLCKEFVYIGEDTEKHSFVFAYNSGEYYKNVKEMKAWLKDKLIVDEYGKTISYTEFWQMVESRQGLPLAAHSTCEMVIDGDRFTNHYIAVDDCEDCHRLVENL
jgi:hypothetical protein